MSNPTTPFSWQMPTATDLVTDLPADFEVFGQAVATSMADLLGGTSGQILAKNSNTDMDFVWVANDVGDITAVTAGTGISGGGTSGAVTITNDMATTITASGDIVVGTGSGTYDNLPIGTTGQILTADTTVSPYKVKWATPAGGGKVLQVVAAYTTTATVTTSSTFATTTLTANITPSSATSKVLVMHNLQEVYKNSGDADNAVKIRLMRGATALSTSSNQTGWTQAANKLTVSQSASYLDSPATTSSTTYTVQFASYINGQQSYVQLSNGESSIILMEIGA